MKPIIPITLITVCTLLFNPNATAGPMTVDSKAITDVSMVPEYESPWNFELKPYGWLSGMYGTTAVRGVSTNVDLDPGDILDALDMAFFINGAIRYKNVGLLTDFMYARISARYETPGPLFSNTSLVSKVTMVDLKASYRLYETERVWLELLAGARYYEQDLTITLNPGLLARRQGSGTEGWWDAVVGFRGEYSLNDKWFLAYMADIGGGSSDLTWQAMASLGYRFTQNVSATVGYRYMDYDYSNDTGYVFDAETRGVVLGLGIEW